MNIDLLDLFVGIVGAIIGYVLSLLTLRFSYKQLFADTVSKNRMDWINVWRENISKFLACAEYLNSNRDKEPCAEMIVRLYEARAMIASRLNLTEELHTLMLAAINTLDYQADSKTFIAQREYILELARQILKPEWERVKREAKGKKH